MQERIFLLNFCAFPKKKQHFRNILRRIVSENQMYFLPKLVPTIRFFLMSLLNIKKSYIERTFINALLFFDSMLLQMINQTILSLTKSDCLSNYIVITQCKNVLTEMRLESISQLWCVARFGTICTI